MLLEILIGVCVFIVLLGVGAVVFFNEREAKKQRSARIEQALTVTIGRQEFDRFADELVAVNAEATRKAGLIPAPPAMRDGRGNDVVITLPPARQYSTGGYVAQAPDRTQRDADYLTSVAIASSYDAPSTRTCSSSSSSSYSSSSCSGSSSSSSSDSGGSSSSCD